MKILVFILVSIWLLPIDERMHDEIESTPQERCLLIFDRTPSKCEGLNN